MIFICFVVVYEHGPFVTVNVAVYVPKAGYVNVGGDIVLKVGQGEDEPVDGAAHARDPTYPARRICVDLAEKLSVCVASRGYTFRQF